MKKRFLTNWRMEYASQMEVTHTVDITIIFCLHHFRWLKCFFLLIRVGLK